MNPSRGAPSSIAATARAPTSAHFSMSRAAFVHAAVTSRMNAGLRRRETRDPFDVAAARTALDRGRDRLECLFVIRERALAGALAGLDDPLVELAQALRGGLDARVGRDRRRAGTRLRAARSCCSPSASRMTKRCRCERSWSCAPDSPSARSRTRASRCSSSIVTANSNSNSNPSSTLIHHYVWPGPCESPSNDCRDGRHPTC